MVEGARGEVLDVERKTRVVSSALRRPAVRDSAEALAREHERRGIAIDARTSTPGWGGERADYGYIVAMIDDHERNGRAA